MAHAVLMSQQVVPAARTAPASPQDLADALRATGYLPDEGLATVAWLAMRLRRPLLLEGEPGTGKTALAEALAESTGATLVRLQCYEGIDASQALYDWDVTRQVLHLRALEAARTADAPVDVETAERSLFDERFLLERPVLRALRTSPSVLLVDEVDRADDEFEAFLLEVLSTWSVTIPELGTVTAADAAARGADLQPHPRGARRPQAPLPLPLGRAPRRWRARSRSSARRLPEVPRAAGRAGGRRHAAAAHLRAAQAARRRRDAGLGAVPASSSARATSTPRRRRPPSAPC